MLARTFGGEMEIVLSRFAHAQRPGAESGISLPELLIVVALVGMTTLVAGVYLLPAEMPLRTGVERTSGFMRQVRMQAIANTSAYRITAPADDRLVAEFAPACSATTWTSQDLSLDLPEDVTLASTLWSVCFSPRGVSSDNVTLTLSHPTFGDAQIEVLLGGATQELLP